MALKMMPLNAIPNSEFLNEYGEKVLAEYFASNPFRELVAKWAAGKNARSNPMPDDATAAQRIRLGYGPNLAISRASSVFDGRVIILDKPYDAVFFHSGMYVLFGLRDDGSHMREGKGLVDTVERMTGVVTLAAKHPTIATGDFLFTDPPGAQIDQARAAFSMAVEAEAELIKEIGERLIALSKGKRT